MTARRHPQRLLIALICGLVGVEFLESGMFVFAATPIMKAIGAGPEQFALAQMAYAVGNVLMVATQQWMTRHFGYRRYLLLALLLFGLGDVGAALASNLPEMVGARLLQGTGGGAFFLSTRVLIPLLFPVPLQRLASYRFMLTIFGVGTLSPALAAMLVDRWGWPSIFWIQTPIVAVLAVGVQRLMPRELGKSIKPVRWSAVPIVLLLLAVGLVQWAFSAADHALLERPGQLALAALAGITLLGLFSLHQWRQDAPLLHLRELAHPGFVAGMGLFTAYYFVVNFNNYLFPQYAEHGLGLSAATTGWLNSFSGLVALVAVVLYRRYSAQVANKQALMLAGCLCMAASAWWMASLPAGAPAAALYAPLAIKGVFGALMILPVSALTWRALGDTHFAKGYQVKNVLRQMMVSLASAAAAVALQGERTAQRARLAHGTATAPGAHLDMQAYFLAGQRLYLWVAVLALLAMAVVAATRKQLR